MSQVQAQHVESEDDHGDDDIQQQRQRAISTISDVGILHNLPPGLLDDVTLTGRSRSNTLFSEFQFSIEGHGHHDIMAEYDANMVVVTGDDNPTISWGDNQEQPLNHPGQPQQQEPPSLEQEDVEQNIKKESSSDTDNQHLPNNEDNDETTITTTTINSTNRRRTSTTKASSTSRIKKEEDDVQHEEVQQQQQQQLLFIRSPSSYETSHFGKRMRSGSLSGRLRSASILEQKGIIDRTQRNLLKDLIISSKSKEDTELQKALDLYECDGDTSGLEQLIHNGYLLNLEKSEQNGRSHSNTLDFLTDDLDLDFLNVKVADDADDDLVTDPSTFLSPMAMAGRSHSDSFMARERADSIQMFSNLLLGGGGTLSGGNNIGSTSSSLENATQSTYQSWITGAGGSSGPQHSQRVVAVAGATIPVTTTNMFSFSTTTANHNTIVPNNNNHHTIEIKQEEDSQQPPTSKQHQQQEEQRSTKANRRGSKTQKKKQTSKDKPTRQQSNETGDGTNDDENKTNDDPQQPVLLGMPRDVLEDPNIRQRIDQDGLLNLDVPEGWIGAYSPTSRKLRLARFNEKRSKRVWTKSVKYDVRKNFADSRLRVKGRFVKKEDEELMRDLISLA